MQGLIRRLILNRRQIVEDNPDLHVDNFVVENVLSGGMGTVYVCQDTEFNIRLAVKTFKTKYMQSDDIRQRFIHESLTWIKSLIQLIP